MIGLATPLSPGLAQAATEHGLSPTARSGEGPAGASPWTPMQDGKGEVQKPTAPSKGEIEDNTTRPPEKPPKKGEGEGNAKGEGAEVDEPPVGEK